MDEQLNIFDAALSAQHDKEAAFYSYIEPHLQKVLDANTIAHEHLEGSKNKGYFSVRFRKNLVFTYKFGKKVNYMSFPIKYKERIPPELGSEQQIKNGIVRVDFESPEAARASLPMLADILDYAIDSYPVAFSCCSRYKQCSDTGHCVNPYKDIAIDCYYRINLKHGKVFY